MEEDNSVTGDVGIRVIVTGAGLAGLAVALATKLANPSHTVVVYEITKELQEIGAGLQITPNATRLLKKWSILDELEPVATVPKTLTVRRYDGTRVLAHEPRLQEKMDERYGSPFWDVHRRDLHSALARRCRELGIVIHLDSRVVSVVFEESTVVLESGVRAAGDVVICAEGLWSHTRSQFLGFPSPPLPTGDLAYRISLETKDLKGPHREEIAAFARSDAVTIWIGPDAHAVSYSARGGELFHVGLLRPDDLPEGVARVSGNVDQMRELFSDWDPFLLRVLGEVDAVKKWRLMWVAPLEEWADKGGRFFMVGDSCHPMIPYLAQGANSALEDGAVLGHLLGKVRVRDKERQLPRVADMYQALRKGRGREIQEESFRQRQAFHMPDGEAQERRDEIMLKALGGEPEAGFPSRWTCPRVQRFLYGYDAYAEAEKLYRHGPF